MRHDTSENFELAYRSSSRGHVFCDPVNNATLSSVKGGYVKPDLDHNSPTNLASINQHLLIRLRAP